MAILFTSDWHIRDDDKLFNWDPKLRGDITVAIDFLKDFIFKNKIKAVFLAGDIFDDKRITSFGISLMNDFIKFCKQANTSIYFVQGQHDLTNPPILSSIDNYCVHLHNKYVEIDGKRIFGLDYIRIPPKEPINISADFLVTHQTFDNFYAFKMDKFSVDHFENVKTIISGDHHHCISVEIKGKQLISLGSLVPRRINEFELRWITVYKGQEFEFEILPSRPYFEFVIFDAHSWKSFCNFVRTYKYSDSLPEVIRTPILLVKYDQNVFSQAEIKSVANDKFAVNCRPLTIQDTEEGVSLNERTVTKTIDDDKIIDEIISSQENKTVRELAKAIIKDGNISKLAEFLEVKIEDVTD
jgi:predicted phosphodiesterase